MPKHHKTIAEFLRTDPRKACAEINSLESRTGFLRVVLLADRETVHNAFLDRTMTL